MLLGATVCLPANAQDSAAKAAAVAAPKESVPASELVRLGPLDKVRYRVAEDPVPSADALILSVNANSEIEFPVTRMSALTIPISVKDKTLSEIRKELKGKLDEDFYLDSTIQLSVTDQAPKGGQVIVFGEVRAAGAIQLDVTKPLTIFEAVLRAGATDFSNLKRVKLHRVNPVTKQVEIKEVNVERIKEGDRSQDVQLQDGDRIDIPERWLVF